MWQALGGSAEVIDQVHCRDAGELPSVYPVTDFATAAVGVAAAAVVELLGARFGDLPRASVSRRSASLWYGWSIRPQGWTMPSGWDPLAGDYATADGWIRLHTNAPHHRDAALGVLGVAADRELVAAAVAAWNSETLESAVVERGGCAAAMHSASAWKAHAQGRSVASEPLLDVQATDGAADAAVGDVHWAPRRDRPLSGLRVLDLTRVLAGPVATRFLAGFGADVLRIDPPEWDEPIVVSDVTLGKRCARLDLRDPAALARLRGLLRSADVLVHGYRADALDRLGLGVAARRQIRPGLIDVCLDAYGWSGPWRNRRGFDSLVQMSTGIAESGMRLLGKARPTPLPVQALDHATGYLMAAAVIRGLTGRLRSGRGFEARASLARTADVLLTAPIQWRPGTLGSMQSDDWSCELEPTPSGPAYRLRSAVEVAQAPMRWDRPASQLGSATPEW